MDPIEWLLEIFNRQPDRILVQPPVTTIREESIKPIAEIRRTLEKITIWVGVDFGTSSTKIAYRELGEQKEVSPITFSHNLKTYPEYCIPSVAAYDIEKGGELFLGAEAAKYLASKPWDEGIRRFKMLVAGHYDKSFCEKTNRKKYFDYLEEIDEICDTKHAVDELHPIYLTITYLAYILQLARKMIQINYPDNELALVFNVGIPVDQRENSDVFNGFLDILAVAEKLEKTYTTPDNTFQQARKYFQKIKYNKEKARIFAIPEAVAIIASYTSSPGAKDGLYTLIDFGSGTTDISIINIKNKELKVWAAKHIPRGMNKVDEIITESIKAHMSEAELATCFKKTGTWSETLDNKIQKSLDELWELTHPVWDQAYRLKMRQSFWSENEVQVYICGGGAQMSYFIADIFCKYCLFGKKGTEPGGRPVNYPIKTIPEPDNYSKYILEPDNYSKIEVPFSRICLAYGLTIPEPLLGKYILPADAPNETPQPKIEFKHANEYHEQDVG